MEILIADLATTQVPGDWFRSAGTNIPGDMGEGAIWRRGTGLCQKPDATGAMFHLVPCRGKLDIGWIPGLNPTTDVSTIVQDFHIAARQVTYPEAVITKNQQTVIADAWNIKGAGRGLSFVNIYGDANGYVFSGTNGGKFEGISIQRMDSGPRLSGVLLLFDGCAHAKVEDVLLYGARVGTQCSNSQSIKYEKVDAWGFTFAGYITENVSDIYYDTCFSTGQQGVPEPGQPLQRSSGANFRILASSQGIGMENCDAVLAYVGIYWDTPQFSAMQCPQFNWMDRCSFDGSWFQKIINAEATCCWFGGGVGPAVYCLSGVGLTLLQCTISDSIGNGVDLVGGEDVKIAFCKILNNSRGAAPNYGGCGVSIGPAVRGALLFGNYFLNRPDGYTGRQQYGVVVWQGAQKYVIKENNYALDYMQQFLLDLQWTGPGANPNTNPNYQLR